MNSISLSMIVKNEEKYLEGCLESIKNVVDEIIIVDTGSTDNTKVIAKKYGAKIFDFVWVNDFSAARNYAKSKCTGDWILYLDADERLDTISIPELKKITSSKKSAAYFCTVKSIDKENSRDNSLSYPRLFINDERIEFSGKVHEQIIPSLQQNSIEIHHADIVITHLGYNVSTEEKKEKAKRNLTLLLEEYKQNSDPYYEYQLGLTYQILNEDENAIKHFENAASNLQLDKQLKAQCYSSLAFISFINHNVVDAESYISRSLELDKEQAFSLFLAAKIMFRKNDYASGAIKCKQAYLINQTAMKRKSSSLHTIHLDPEEIIYFGLTVALYCNDVSSYQYFQKELLEYYSKIDGRKSSTVRLFEKVFTNKLLSEHEMEILAGVINENNLGFFTTYLQNMQNKQQALFIVERISLRFPVHSDVQKLLANIYDSAGRTDEAIRILENLAESDQSDPAIYFYMISYYLKAQTPEKIINVVKSLEKYFSHIPEVFERVIILKQKLGMA